MTLSVTPSLSGHVGSGRSLIPEPSIPEPRPPAFKSRMHEPRVRETCGFEFVVMDPGSMSRLEVRNAVGWILDKKGYEHTLGTGVTEVLRKRLVEDLAKQVAAEGTASRKGVPVTISLGYQVTRPGGNPHSAEARENMTIEPTSKRLAQALVSRARSIRPPEKRLPRGTY